MLKQNNVGHDFNYTEEIDERDYKGRKIFRAYALFSDGGKIENGGFYSSKRDCKDVYKIIINIGISKINIISLYKR